MSQTIIRRAEPTDLSAVVTILNWYIQESHASFDEQPLQPEERRAWFEGYKAEGPYRMWVAALEGQVVGVTYSSRYREHPAFRETIETSIYLAPGAVGRGLGSALYSRLFASLSQERLHRALAGIALPNPASVALHKRFGFLEVGVFHEYAVKRGVRISSVWLEKSLSRDESM